MRRSRDGFAGRNDLETAGTPTGIPKGYGASVSATCMPPRFGHPLRAAALALGGRSTAQRCRRATLRHLRYASMRTIRTALRRQRGMCTTPEQTADARRRPNATPCRSASVDRQKPRVTPSRAGASAPAPATLRPAQPSPGSPRPAGDRHPSNGCRRSASDRMQAHVRPARGQSRRCSAARRSPGTHRSAGGWWPLPAPYPRVRAGIGPRSMDHAAREHDGRQRRVRTVIEREIDDTRAHRGSVQHAGIHGVVDIPSLAQDLGRSVLAHDRGAHCTPGSGETVPLYRDGHRRRPPYSVTSRAAGRGPAGSCD